MNKCRVLKEISAYFDGQLKPAGKANIEEHLKSCKICAQELVRLRALSDQLKAWQEPQLKESFASSVRDEIVSWELERGQVKMKKKTLAILVPSGALISILAIFFVGHLFFAAMPAQKDQFLKSAVNNIGSIVNKSELEPYYLNTDVDTQKDIQLGLLGISNEFKGVLSSPIIVSQGLAKRKGSEYGTSYNKFEQASYQAKGMLGAALGGGTVMESADSGRVMYSKSMDRGFLGASVPGTDVSVSEGRIIVIQPVLPATGQGDKIIRTAIMRVRVDDGKEANKKISQICQELGGYLASSSFYRDEEGREAGTVNLRIPKDKFLVALDKLSALGKVEQSRTDSQDVAQQYSNIKAHLDAAMVVYNKTLEALQKKQTTINESIRLESELTPVLQRVEILKNQLEQLNNAVSFTNITVNFYEPKVSAKVLKENKENIKESILIAKINAVKFWTNAIPKALTWLIFLFVCIITVLVLALVAKYWIMPIFKRG
ncbi:MAG: DUF4349 domain-containing protein [Candidatus Omnitrophota bacterium]